MRHFIIRAVVFGFIAASALFANAGLEVDRGGLSLVEGNQAVALGKPVCKMYPEWCRPPGQ